MVECGVGHSPIYSPARNYDWSRGVDKDVDLLGGERAGGVP